MTKKPTYKELEQTVKDFEKQAGTCQNDAKGFQHKSRVPENIFQALGQPALILNTNHKILAANSATIKITDRPEKDLVGRKCYELFHDADQPPENCPLMKMLISGQIETEEMEVQAFDRSFLVSCTPVFSESGEISTIIHIATDITARKQAEAEKAKLETRLRQAQKMEAIATLAGGIAHQFNNALHGITGNIDLLKMAVPDAAQLKDYVNPMKDSAQRMANLTNQLLAYARGGKYRSKTIAINQLLSDTLPILSHTIGAGIRVETDLCPDMLHIEADLTQMQMALSAILINASEAIETQGWIQITTRLLIADTEFLEHHPGLKPGPYVCLTIADNGKGMDQETKSKIFEPFFTTKFPGRGLGMASVYGIVKTHDGWISAASELDAGTQIQIYLPIIDIPLKSEQTPKIEPRKGTGTILLIEDEEIIVNVVQAMLKRLGYHVLVARNGTEAVDIVKTFDKDIDLALLDIKLPDMNGSEVYSVIKDIRPDSKVIVCSGYSLDGPAQEILNAGAHDFIKKPFSFEILAKKLSDALKPES